jgi:hypothetical protein
MGYQYLEKEITEARKCGNAENADGRKMRRGGPVSPYALLFKYVNREKREKTRDFYDWVYPISAKG